MLKPQLEFSFLGSKTFKAIPSVSSVLKINSSLTSLKYHYIHFLSAIQPLKLKNKCRIKPAVTSPPTTRGFLITDAPQFGNYHRDNTISGFLYRVSELSVHTFNVVTKAVRAHRLLKSICHQAITISLARVFYPCSASKGTVTL